MAAKSLPPAATLFCFLLLLVVAAQVKDATAIATTTLVILGTARCKRDPSRIITNTSLKLVMNKVVIPGGNGSTTSTGEVAMAVRLTSQEEVASLRSGKAFLVAPPHACGAPSFPRGTQLAAAVNVTAVVSGGAGREQRPSNLAASDGRIISGGNNDLHAADQLPTIAGSDGLVIFGSTVISRIENFASRDI